MLWASGAANYLWNAVLILGLLLPYRIYIFSNQTIKDNIFNAVIMGGLGWLAGCTNENSGGASVLLCLFFVVCLWIKKKPIPKWAISGICGGGLGMTILLMAPGNYRISSKTDINGLLERGKNVLRITKEQLGILFIIFCIIMLIYIAIKRKIENDSWMQLPLFYVIAAIASICVLVFSAMQPERTWFIGIVLILVAVSYVYVEILTIPRVMIGIVTMGAIVMFSVSFGQELPKINETYIQVKEGVDLIEEALEKGEKVVSIPMVTPSDSKYDAFNGTSYVKEPAEDWMNAWIAEYYGIEAVEGYQKFE